MAGLNRIAQGLAKQRAYRGDIGEAEMPANTISFTLQDQLNERKARAQREIEKVERIEALLKLILILKSY